MHIYNNSYLPFFWVLVILHLILVYTYYNYNSTYKFLFTNPLGYLLFIIIIGISYYINPKFGIYIGFLSGLLFFISGFISRMPVVEGFTWSTELTDQFTEFEETRNPNVIFDLDFIKSQATEEEVRELIETGLWPWDEETRDAFVKNVESNTLVRTSADEAMADARSIYNQTVMKQMLSWNTKEGKFLLTGVVIDNGPRGELEKGENTYGEKSGLVSPNMKVIKCGKDTSSTTDTDSGSGSGSLVMQETVVTGVDGVNTTKQTDVTNIDYNKLPELVPGFSFVNSPCNPCTALNKVPDYSCPFILKDKNGDGISSIWKNLWGVDNSQPSSIDSETFKGQKEFPIFLELKGVIKIKDATQVETA